MLIIQSELDSVEAELFKFPITFLTKIVLGRFFGSKPYIVAHAHALL